MTAPTGVTAVATLTSTGSLTAPKLGDVLTYTVKISGDVVSISPGTVQVNGQTVQVSGGPWSFTEPEVISAPVVAGLTLTKPFSQTADPHVWTATV